MVNLRLWSPARKPPPSPPPPTPIVPPATNGAPREGPSSPRSPRTLPPTPTPTPVVLKTFGSEQASLMSSSSREQSSLLSSASQKQINSGNITSTSSRKVSVTSKGVTTTTAKTSAQFPNLFFPRPDSFSAATSWPSPPPVLTQPTPKCSLP
ncbi:unnamed protein product [Cyprideis torosa]|uniref:Uncharacterized protein n=1 Tax=Cyprideis torosa TaxID=163714 RepID=A0A7R8W8E0_9CRUS|nr:unnamed protein product [Cyprideis torosa]CAG0888488.1 unnamed protein product [Cyprideis torosa]